MNVKTKIGMGVFGFVALALMAGGGNSAAVKSAKNLFNRYKGIKEDSSRFNAILTTMWEHLGWSDSSVEKAIERKFPWSAAFISYVMRHYDDFPKHSSHSHYIVVARKNEENKQGNFRLKRIDQYKPKIGDIVCKGRAGNNYTYDSIRKGNPTHTDLVIDIQGNTLITIGGNVSNQISITKVPLKNGFINKKGYFAIIQNRHNG